MEEFVLDCCILISRWPLIWAIFSSVFEWMEIWRLKYYKIQLTCVLRLEQKFLNWLPSEKFYTICRVTKLHKPKRREKSSQMGHPRNLNAQIHSCTANAARTTPQIHHLEQESQYVVTIMHTHSSMLYTYVISELIEHNDKRQNFWWWLTRCLLYTSDAADE